MKPTRIAPILLIPLIPLAAQTEPPADADEIIELSPFTVTAETFNGYYAAQTLAGTRLKTNLDEVASSIQVVTPEFMADVGANNLNDLFLFTTSTEASGINGNFSDYTEGETATNDTVTSATTPKARPPPTTAAPAPCRRSPSACAAWPAPI
jgi:hypothetical protein